MQGFLAYFKIEQLNIIMAVTGLLITFLTMMTARSHIKTAQKKYYILNIIFMISFIGIIFTKDWIVFIIAWEMVTVSTALMLLWKSRGLTGQYLIVQFLGSSFLIFTILLAIRNGYTEVVPIKDFWLQSLFVLGFGMKSAIFGLHFWLPAVHSQAPAPVSAILSGWVVKLGFIMYLKIIPDGNILLFILGILMVSYGGIKALLASDYKVLLAYSSISQLGFIAIGIGSGTTLGYLGSVFHIIAHSLAKTSLFIGSGYLTGLYDSRNIYEFKNAWRRPILINLSIITGFGSLMGTPLLAGFNSKYLIKSSFYGEQAFNIKTTMPLWMNFIFAKKFIIFNVTDGELVSFILYGLSLLTGLYSIRFLYWGLFKGIKKDRTSLLSSLMQDIRSNLRDSDNGAYNLGKQSMENISQKISKLDSLVLSIPIILIVLLAFYTTPILNTIMKIDLHFDLLHGYTEFTFMLILILFILKFARCFKTTNNKLPSLDLIFYNINKSFHKSARNLYTALYQDFQYQLLLIPIFILFLFVFIYL